MAHDHHHDDNDHRHDNELGPMDARVRALETILVGKGLIDPKAIAPGMKRRGRSASRKSKIASG